MFANLIPKFVSIFSRDRNEVTHILRRWPNVSHEVLAKKYPDVNLAKILRDDKARGHFAPKI